MLFRFTCLYRANKKKEWINKSFPQWKNAPVSLPIWPACVHLYRVFRSPLVWVRVDEIFCRSELNLKNYLSVDCIIILLQQNLLENWPISGGLRSISPCERGQTIHVREWENFNKPLIGTHDPKTIFSKLKLHCHVNVWNGSWNMFLIIEI